jgi:hypothetical protein
MNDPWEYKVVFFSANQWTGTGLPNDLNEKFDEFGAQGWEMVGTESIVRPAFWGYGSKTVGVVAFFKRRLQR